MYLNEYILDIYKRRAQIIRQQKLKKNNLFSTAFQYIYEVMILLCNTHETRNIGHASKYKDISLLWCIHILI